MSGKTETKVDTKIEVKTANEWEALMATSEVLTPKQMVFAEFEKLTPQDFIIVPVADKRSQEQFVLDVSVFLGKKGYDAKKKMVRKHPTDQTKIVVRRLA